MNRPHVVSRASLPIQVGANPADQANATLNATDLERAFVDMYFVQGSTVTRLSIVVGKIDYKGLGADLKPIARENLALLLQRITQRFAQTETDKRLEAFTPPRATPIGGTRTLAAVLESIDPDLRDLPQSDYLSRMIFFSML